MTSDEVGLLRCDLCAETVIVAKASVCECCHRIYCPKCSSVSVISKHLFCRFCCA